MPVGELICKRKISPGLYAAPICLHAPNGRYLRSMRQDAVITSRALDRGPMATLHRKMAGVIAPALTGAAFRTLLWPPNGAGMACSVVRFPADFSGLTIP